MNAGGIINVASEIGMPYNAERAREQTERIYETIQRVCEISGKEEIPTSQAADRLAEDRLASGEGHQEDAPAKPGGVKCWRAVRLLLYI